MKRSIKGAQFIAPLFVFLALHSASTRVRAQAALTALEVSPTTLGADGVLTLSMHAAPQDKSIRIALYEHLRPTKIAEIKKNFVLQNGRWSTHLMLQADPGSYDLRVVSDDKTRAPLSSDAQVLVPGIVREPGWWLLNGSPFAEAPKPDDAPAPPNAPLFIPGLKRDGKKFDRKVFVSDGAPLRWRVISLPSLQEIVSDPNYDYNALQQRLAAQITEARGKPERNFIGFTVSDSSAISSLFGSIPILPPQVRDIMKHLRQILAALQPDAALIYQTTFGSTAERGNTSQNLQLCSDLFDAVVLRPNFMVGPAPEFASSWNIKNARRIAEEQENYDLPIFLISPWPSPYRPNENSIPINHREVLTEALMTEFWMAGASGAIFNGRLVDLNNALDNLHYLVQRNASLFIGAATLEDAGVLPIPPQSEGNERNLVFQASGLFALLQNAGRIPGAARLQPKPDKKIPESFLCVLGDSISGDTIEKLRVAANGGARIYVEGAPKLEDDVVRWNALVGAASTPVANKQATMALDDVWLFGTSRGSKVLVQQSVQVGALNPPTPKPKKDATEKGKDVLTEPRVVARLEDGSPALIENPIGEGEVLWSPHRVLAGSATRNSTPHTSDFYAAIAAHLGTGLIKIRAADGKSTPNVRAAIRRSPKGTWLVGLFNESTQAAPIVLEANHFAGVALDLGGEKTLPLDVRGNRSSVETTIPASGWQIIALGESREKLDDERYAPRSKAKLK
jgi:hypothetical protein